jgi:hypothetical protein
MTFTELVAEVYNLTNRSDLSAETQAAVRAATLKAHQTDFYSKDIYETGVSWEDAEYRQQIDLISLVSNFRALKYIRRVEDQYDDKGVFFTIITPEELLDSYGFTRSDIAYVAGRSLEIRSAVEFSKVLMGAYVFPIITSNSYASWIAEQHPYFIIYEASRVIFKAIGYDEQSAQFNNLVAEELTLLKMSGLSDVGY